MCRDKLIKLLLAAAGIVCLAFDGKLGAAQEANARLFSVYVSALEGECLAGQDSIYIQIKGRLTRRSQLPPEKSLTPLEFFSEDASTRNQIEDLFSKQKNLRVVRTLKEADFAFCVCTQFRGGDRNAYERLGVLAMAVSAAQFSQSPDSPKDLKSAAFWHADNLKFAMPERIDAGQAGSIYVYQDFIERKLPNDLAKRFLQDLPGLTEKIAALRKAPLLVNEPASVKKRPGLDRKSEDRSQTNPTGIQPIAGSDPDRMRIQTTLVTLPVTVVDKNGHALPGLKQQDFQVYEDNVKQELAGFGQTQQPFHVVLMIDRSCNAGSIQGEDFKEAALYFFDRLPPKSKMMVVSFSREVLIETEFTDDRELLARAFSRRLNFVGSTQRLHDALEFVLTGRLDRVKGQKAIILFTNGQDHGSRMVDWSNPSKRLKEADVIVYPVYPGGLISPLNPLQRHAKVAQKASILENLAEETGGAYYLLPSIGHAPLLFANIADDMQRFYWLSYYPANDSRDNRYRRINVEINRSEAKVRTRKGYQAAGTEKISESRSK